MGGEGLSLSNWSHPWCVAITLDFTNGTSRGAKGIAPRTGRKKNNNPNPKAHSPEVLRTELLRDTEKPLSTAEKRHATNSGAEVTITMHITVSVVDLQRMFGSERLR